MVPPKEIGVGNVVRGFAFEVGDYVGGVNVEEAVCAALRKVPVVKIGLKNFVIGGVYDCIGF